MIPTPLLERRTTPLPEPYNPRGVNPALLTYGEYLNLVNPNGKGHPTDAYDVTLADLNRYGGSATDYPHLLKTVTLRGLRFTFRLKAEKLKYNRRKADDTVDADDPYLSDAEIEAKSLRPHEFMIRAFNEEGECVASAQDEWGAMLIMVAREYRGFGLGPILGKLARSMEPAKSSGGFTSDGRYNFFKVYQTFVRDALHAGLYRRLIADGSMTPERAKEIVKSAGLPAAPKKPDPLDLSVSDPSHWLLYAKDGAFILYDRKLADIYVDHLNEWGERFIRAYTLVRLNEWHGETFGIVVRFGGETPNLRLYMLALGASFCAEEGATFMVDESERDLLTERLFEIGEPNMVTGFKRYPVKIREPLVWKGLAAAERAFRKSFDTYHEFQYAMMELADMKYPMGGAP